MQQNIQELQKPKDKVPLMMGIVFGAVALIAIIGVCLFAIKGNSIESTIDSVFALMDGDVDSLYSIFPNEVIDKKCENLGMNRSQFELDLVESFEDQKDKYGDYTTSYEITNIEDVDGETLSVFQKIYSEDYDLNVTEANKVEVKYAVKGNREEETGDEIFYLIKIDGSWYIDIDYEYIHVD